MTFCKDFKKLERAFYLRNSVDVAYDLLGKLLVRVKDDIVITGKIVEVEVYRSSDPASHSYNGLTERNSAMFMMGGFLYVYFTYGMHYCANIVTEKENYGAAVLLRALEPVEGFDQIKLNRGNIAKDINLTNGPAKLCKAFDITKDLNKEDLLGEKIFCAYGSEEGFRIKKATRIGIRHAKDKPLRFYIQGNPYVSAI